MNYPTEKSRRTLLSLAYLLMAGFLLWGYINTFVHHKGHPIMFILAVLMCISFGVHFYYKTAKTLREQYV